MTEERIQLEEPTQATLREARRLVRRKDRKSLGKFIVEGPQAVREALKSPGVVEALFLRWANVREHLDLLSLGRAAGVPVYGVSEQNLATLSDTVTPQGLLAVCPLVPVPLADVLAARLVRDGRMKEADACFRFLPTRAKLDLMGWGEEDIFAHS